MSAFIARSGWMHEQALRLDAGAYGEGGLAIRDHIVGGGYRWQQLAAVAHAFNAPRYTRRYVSESNRGTPILSSSDILLADLAGVPRLSNKATPELPQLLLQQGSTLISRSGTIGNTAFVRREMVGMAASEHVMRAVPLNRAIAPGYLFAFLTSRQGQVLLRQHTYGSVIQHIEPQHIADLPVPLPDDAEQERIHQLVQRAADARTEAARLLDEAARYFDDLAGPMPSAHDHAYATSIAKRSRLGLRLDAFHNVGWTREGRELAGTPIGDMAAVRRPGIFKRIFVQHGIPLVSGIDVYQVRPSFRQRLMRVEAERANCFIQAGQVLVQRSGQRYGLLGRPAYVGQRMEGWAASEDLITIKPRDAAAAATIFAYLRSRSGRRALLRHSYGTSIPHLDPEGVSKVEIPPLPHTLLGGVQRALELREWADEDEGRAIREVEAWLG